MRRRARIRCWRRIRAPRSRVCTRTSPEPEAGTTGGSTLAAANPLPPGSNGLPLLGETLAFASNPFAFVSQRRARFGDVFRTHLVGKPTVFIAGPKHVGTWLVATKIEREGAMPANLLALFGGSADIV